MNWIFGRILLGIMFYEDSRGALLATVERCSRSATLSYTLLYFKSSLWVSIPPSGVCSATCPTERSVSEFMDTTSIHVSRYCTFFCCSERDSSSGFELSHMREFDHSMNNEARGINPVSPNQFLNDKKVS